MSSSSVSKYSARILTTLFDILTSSSKPMMTLVSSFKEFGSKSIALIKLIYRRTRCLRADNHKDKTRASKAPLGEMGSVRKPIRRPRSNRKVGRSHKRSISGRFVIFLPGQIDYCLSIDTNALLLGTVPAIFRFAERHVHSGLTELLTEDLGLLPTGGIGSVKRGRSPSSSRSPSPPLPRTNKRGPSEERYQRRSPSPRRDRDRDSGKRQRRDSPSPSRRGYGGSDRRPLSPPFMRDRHYQPPPPPAVLNNRPPPPSAIVPPPRPYGEIPDGVAFFMGLLPMVNLFNGPILPGHIMMDLISGMNLPRGNGGGRTPIQMGNASGPMAMGSNRYGRI